ncbi:MAG: LamG-like jellyroll fold domain-containing protein, partial [Cyclobacteriaceae bacterium]
AVAGEFLATATYDAIGGGEFELPAKNVTYFFNKTYQPGDEVYFYLTADINSGATLGNTFSADLFTVENIGTDNESENNDVGLTAGATFTINAGTPQVQVIAPNGGEVLESGTVYPISWSTINMSGSDNIQVRWSANGGASFATITSGTIDQLNGSFDWTIPNLIGTNNIIRVRNTTLGITDNSDAPFEIVAELVPTITIVSPNGGESLEQNSEQTIIFQYENLDPSEVLIVEYSDDYAITWNVLATGSAQSFGNAIEWFIDENEFIEGAGYFIRVRTQSGNATDQSDAPFTVAPPADATLTVLGPNGGESFEQNSTVVISWTGTNIPEDEDLLIEYSGNGGATYTLIKTLELAGQVETTWFIDADDYNLGTTSRIRIRSELNTVVDASDADFSIISPTGAEDLQIVSPNGGESIVQNSTVQILFETVGIGVSDLLEISYSDDNGSSWNQIAVNSLSEFGGSYNWTPDNTYVPGNEYLILVSNLFDPSFQDESDGTFTIEEEYIIPEVTFEAVGLSDASVIADQTVLLYKYKQTVAGSDLTSEYHSFELKGNYNVDDFVDSTFELLVNPDEDNIGNATSLGSVGFGGEPFPSNGFGWNFSDVFTAGSTAYFYIQATVSSGPTTGSTFFIDKPVAGRFEFANSENPNVAGLSQGTTFTINGGTEIVAPSVQASNIQVDPLYETADFTWTNGSGAARIVAYKEGSGGFPTVTDNTTYGLNAGLGNGWTVIYNGSENSTSFDGFKEDSDYSLAILEYNGTGGNEKYQRSLTTNNPRNFSTLNRPNLALDFDGVDDHLIIGDGTEPNMRLGRTFSVEAYVKPAVLSGGIMVIAQKGSVGGEDFRITAFDSDIFVSVQNTTEPELFTHLPGVLAVDEWRLVSVTYDGSFLKVYIDGSLLVTEPVTMSTVSFNFDEPNYVGINPDGVSEPF